MGSYSQELANQIYNGDPWAAISDFENQFVKKKEFRNCFQMLGCLVEGPEGLLHIM